MSLELYDTIPSVKKYNELRSLIGWGEISEKAATAGLNNSFASVCAVLDGNVIGIGRIVGDGGIYFYIQDMIVHPDFQRQGFGKQIMEHLLERLKSYRNEKAMVLLMAAKGKAGFYEKFGFRARDNDAPGMMLKIPN